MPEIIKISQMNPEAFKTYLDRPDDPSVRLLEYDKPVVTESNTSTNKCKCIHDRVQNYMFRHQCAILRKSARSKEQ